jgi:hypothetical protein
MLWFTWIVALWATTPSVVRICNTSSHPSSSVFARYRQLRVGESKQSTLCAHVEVLASTYHDRVRKQKSSRRVSHRQITLQFHLTLLDAPKSYHQAILLLLDSGAHNFELVNPRHHHLAQQLGYMMTIHCTGCCARGCTWSSDSSACSFAAVAVTGVALARNCCSARR